MQKLVLLTAINSLSVFVIFSLAGRRALQGTRSFEFLIAFSLLLGTFTCYLMVSRG